MVLEETRQKTIKYSTLGVLVLQNVSSVLFMKSAMTGERPKFIKAIAVFYGEILKFVASIILCCVSHRSLAKGLTDIYTECVQKKMDFAKTLLPAALCTFLNILVYVAVDNLSSATYTVAYQLKIFTSALVTVFALKRPLTKQQWIALFSLFAGVVVVSYDPQISEKIKQEHEQFNGTNIDTTTLTPHHKEYEDNNVIGFIAIIGSCVMSGFVGVYFEKILKGSTVSIWMRNFQLAGPSIIFSLISAFAIDYKIIFQDGFNPLSIGSNLMQGFDWLVWTTIVISALGGLLVAFVIKFADNILKTFATAFAIILNCVFSYFLFSFHPTFLFVVGACVVIISIFFYSIYPVRKTNNGDNGMKKEESKNKPEE